MSIFAKVHSLALNDYRHEWRMSSCFVLALAAVLAPMMVLFGLKFGIITSMVDKLIEDPENREIRPVGSSRYSPQWFETLRARDDVEFVIPRTRAISAIMDLGSKTSGRILKGELIPSAAGDPLLRETGAAPGGYDRVILSARLARKLDVRPGDEINGSISRRFRDKRERTHLKLTVAAIAPEAAFSRNGAFVSLALVNAAEDFRDGRAVPELGWAGSEAVRGAREYSGFRLFARSIYDVAELRDALEAQGIEVRTRAADIEMVQSLDQNLSLIFWIIALVGLTGFSLSLGASLWANVDRKTRELSVLRLVGFRTGHIIWFPIFQGLFTGVLGWLLACGIYIGIEQSINTLFPEQPICLLLPEHYTAALGLTVVSAVISALLGGWRAAGIEPSDGVREI